MLSCVGLHYLRCKGWGWVLRVRRSVRKNDKGIFDIPLRPHNNDRLSRLRRVVNYRRARSRHMWWRSQHQHATIGENKTSIAGKTRATKEVHTLYFFVRFVNLGG